MKVIQGTKPATKEEILASIIGYEESGIGTIVKWDSNSKVKPDARGVKEVIESLYNIDKLIIVQEDQPNEKGTLGTTFYGNMYIITHSAKEAYVSGAEFGFKSGFDEGYKVGYEKGSQNKE